MIYKERERGSCSETCVLREGNGRKTHQETSRARDGKEADKEGGREERRKGWEEREREG